MKPNHLSRQGLLPDWDRVAVVLSALCAVHCIATGVVVALAASVGGLFGSPLVHEVGLGLALLLGIIALGTGARQHRLRMPILLGAAGLASMAAGHLFFHGMGESIATLIGVTVLAIAHLRNRKALTRSC